MDVMTQPPPDSSPCGLYRKKELTSSSTTPLRRSNNNYPPLSYKDEWQQCRDNSSTVFINIGVNALSQVEP